MHILLCGGVCVLLVQQERVIENAFTELFVSTGDFAEIRPPPVWKSVVLTVIPLHVSQVFVLSFTPNPNS